MWYLKITKRGKVTQSWSTIASMVWLAARETPTHGMVLFWKILGLSRKN
jgi:hypothetical protein